MFGSSDAELKRWSNRKKTRWFPVGRMSIPDESTYRLNKFVTLAVGVMFVTGVSFLSLFEEDKIPDSGISSST